MQEGDGCQPILFLILLKAGALGLSARLAREMQGHDNGGDAADRAKPLIN